MLHFDAENPATGIVAAWLAERRSELPDTLRSFGDRYALLDVKAAAPKMTTACLRSDAPLDEMDALGITPELFRASWLCISVLRCAGAMLADLAAPENTVTRLRALLANSVKRAIAGSTCDESLKTSALRAVVDGLVRWQQASAATSSLEAVLSFLLDLNGDPRFLPQQWYGRVADQSVRAVESWLSRETIEAFFRVIDALKTDNDAMWRARHSFWLAYLPYVTGAWLIAGPEAEKEARRHKVGRCATFEGPGTQKHHCGLLLRLGSVHVLEMNMNGSAIFWREGAYKLPGLFQDTYNRKQYRDRADSKEVFVHQHVRGWQQRFAERIHLMGGPLVRGDRW
jgi:hypothetical protein